MKAAEFDKVPPFVPPDWCVAGGKGGTKKTMTAFHVAIVLSRSGKTVVHDTDPKSQSLTLWTVAHRHLTGKELPFHVIQYTATSGLAAHAARTKQALNAKHLVFDIGGDTEANIAKPSGNAPN
jgi:cellulose biosynthesis protein BcsQ